MTESFNPQVHLINCPHCRKGLYLPMMEGHDQVLCPKCTSAYRFHEFRFIEKAIETQGENKFLYRLRVQSHANAEPEALSFTFSQKNLSFFQQDRLLVVRQSDRVVFLKNLTEGWYEYFQESRLAQYFGMGLLSLGVGGCLSMFVGWPGLFATPVVGGIFAYITKNETQRRRRALSEQLSDARSIQQALSAIAHDNAKLQQVQEESNRVAFALKRLPVCQSRQKGLGGSPHQIQVYDRAIAQATKSRAKMSHLARQYREHIEELWVAIEIRHLAALMPSSIIEYQMESEEMEAQFQAERDAISEINRLLEGNGE